MSFESHWYSSFRGGKPPRCKRLCRQSKATQWIATIDLAIEMQEGSAGWRHATIALTGERYWWFRGGWWLLTNRCERRASLIRSAAFAAETHRSHAHGSGIVDSRDVATRLRRWKATGHWRRHAARVPSLQPKPKKSR